MGEGEEAAGEFFDGLSAQKHGVSIDLGGDGIIVSARDGEALARWPFKSLRRIDFAQEEFRLRSTQGQELARLIVRDPSLQQTIIKSCPDLNKDVSRPSQWGKIVFWSLAATASIVLTIQFGAPWLADKAAIVAPVWMEEQLGAATEKQIRFIFSGQNCQNPEGVAAYRKLIGQIAQDMDLQTPVRAEIISSAFPNALSLPGGKIYLFSALLDNAENPDEIAGVLAHELGHLKHRDGMRRLAQISASSFLYGLLFGDVFGAGVAIAIARQLSDASYSRQAEYDADSVAINAMTALGRPVAPMGELILRITGESRGPGESFSSHPMSEARLERFKQADAKQISKPPGKPLLTPSEWGALKAVCHEGGSH